MCAGVGHEIEDWTANLKNLCKACSEGRPHEGHDQELKGSAPWNVERRVGFAAMDRDSLEGVLREWAAKPGRRMAEMQCTLEAIKDPTRRT